MEIQTAITFDDLLLVPQKSELSSRDDVDLGTKIDDFFRGPSDSPTSNFVSTLGLPIISAPMDTVTEGPMAAFMSRIGGLGIIHRYNTIDEQVAEIKWALENGAQAVGASVGSNGNSWERLQKVVEAGANPIVVDVAHGHTTSVMEFIRRAKNEYPTVTMISGNIATAEAAKDLAEAGVDALRVGVGSGSACTTRVVAGIGVPQATAILEVKRGLNEAGMEFVKIISDGGHRNSGDIVKALALGANCVMLGGMLAKFPVAAGEFRWIDIGQDSDLNKVFDMRMSDTGKDAVEVFNEGIRPIEQPNRVIKKKVFRGMASGGALIDYKGDSEEHIREGEEFLVDIDHNFEQTMKDIINGIKIGLAYNGAKDIIDLQEKASFMVITPASYAESLPHYK